MRPGHVKASVLHTQMGVSGAIMGFNTTSWFYAVDAFQKCPVHKIAKMGISRHRSLHVPWTGLWISRWVTILRFLPAWVFMVSIAVSADHRPRNCALRIGEAALAENQCERTEAQGRDCRKQESPRRQDRFQTIENAAFMRHTLAPGTSGARLAGTFRVALVRPWSRVPPARVRRAPESSLVRQAAPPDCPQQSPRPARRLVRPSALSDRSCP